MAEADQDLNRNQNQNRSQGDFLRTQEFQDRLKKCITSAFVNHVTPDSVIHIFHEVNPEVLTRADVENIEADTRNYGPMKGARTLLDRVVRYRDWYNCIVKVLDHEEVKLTHVADHVKDQYAIGVIDFLNRKDLTPEQRLKKDALWEEQTEDNFKLSEDGTYFSMAEDEAFLANLEDEGNANWEEEEDLSGEEEEDDYEMPVPRPLPPLPESKKRRGPEYDFSREETSKALSPFSGWHDYIAEKKVDEVLKKYVRRDGHYILWYWERKKRPGVCITHDTIVKTFIIHKELPNEENKNMTYYYIQADETHEDTLQKIMNFSLKEGIRDVRSTDGRRIELKYPVRKLD